MFTLLKLFTSSLALAAGGEGHGGGHGEIPFVVVYQAINLLILMVGLFIFTRKPIIEMFTQKRADFLAAKEKANSALQKAKDQHAEIQTRLSKIQSTQEETISRAKADAADLKKQILADADAMVARLKAEAQAAAQIEIQRAKNELREQLLTDSFEKAKKDISAKATVEDQVRLQQDFINKVGVAQ